MCIVHKVLGIAGNRDVAPGKRGPGVVIDGDTIGRSPATTTAWGFSEVVHPLSQPRRAASASRRAACTPDGGTEWSDPDGDVGRVTRDAFFVDVGYRGVPALPARTVGPPQLQPTPLTSDAVSRFLILIRRPDTGSNGYNSRLMEPSLISYRRGLIPTIATIKMKASNYDANMAKVEKTTT
jgi:hypothetical protein